MSAQVIAANVQINAIRRSGTNQLAAGLPNALFRDNEAAVGALIKELGLTQGEIDDEKRANRWYGLMSLQNKKGRILGTQWLGHSGTTCGTHPFKDKLEEVEYRKRCVLPRYERDHACQTPFGLSLKDAENAWYLTDAFSAIGGVAPLEIVPKHPSAPSYAQMRCYNNVAAHVERHGGKIAYGYALYHGKWHWEMERHCVWESDAGRKFDLTPTVAHETETYFLRTADIPEDELVSEIRRGVWIWKATQRSEKKKKTKKGKKVRKKRR